MKLWSDPETWGDNIPPFEGDSVHIPTGTNILFDLDSTPTLNLILVEGGLIFLPEEDPDHLRTFDAHYIFANYGMIQVGTEAYPYTSKIEITLHGEENDPSIPLFGNKVLGIRYGSLDLIGN